MNITTNAVVAAGHWKMELDIPDIPANFDNAPTEAAQDLAGQFLGFATIVAFVAFIAIMLVLLFAGLSPRLKSIAWVAFAVAGLATAVMGSISGAMGFFSDINLFG